MCTWGRISVLAALMLASVRVYAQNDIPTDWIDPDTGHRVIRLSREDGSQSSYFHQNEFTPDGKRLVFTAPAGLYTVDLQTHAVEQIRAGRTGLLCAGRLGILRVARRLSRHYRRLDRRPRAERLWWSSGH